MIIDINVILTIGLIISFYLHWKQHKLNQEDKKVEYHTHNYYTEVITEEDEEGMRY